MKTFISQTGHLSDKGPYNGRIAEPRLITTAGQTPSTDGNRRLWLTVTLLASLLASACGEGLPTDAVKQVVETESETTEADDTIKPPPGPPVDSATTTQTDDGPDQPSDNTASTENDAAPVVAAASSPSTAPEAPTAAVDSTESSTDALAGTDPAATAESGDASGSGDVSVADNDSSPDDGTASAPTNPADTGTDSTAVAETSAAGATSAESSTESAYTEPETDPATGGDSGDAFQELTASSDKQITDPFGSTDGTSSRTTVMDSKAEVENTATTTATQTYFESNNTAGFSARLLEDNTIVVSWEADPDARGYNVYRQAEYLTTVFATEFRDLNAPDGSYYYEIEAFKPPNDELYRIARGLTVEVGSAQVRSKPSADLPPMLSPDYQLVFADEFNTQSLDESKWNTRFLWGPNLIINSEVQYYVDTRNDRDFGYNPFRFDSDNLIIRGVPTPEHLKAKANNQPYLSGIITSYDAFKFTYGYAEIRAKMPFGQGLWPAFWLLNAYYDDRRPEIDIVEFIGHDQDAAHHTYHYFDYENRLRSTELYPTVGMDFTHDFHTFGALWKPGSIVFYVDGVERKRVDDVNVSHEQMYVLVNLAMGGWWAGDPSADTPFPADYIIDYVRVYQGNPQQDYPGLADGSEGSSIPLASESLTATPNHLPPREDWPAGYPYD